MIEILINDYLNKSLSTPSFLENPKNTLERYILLERTSGSETNQIKTATFAIQSYAESMFEAAKLNEEVKQAMKEIIYHEDISKSKLNSDYNFTDTETKEYRYQAVFDVWY